MSAQRHHGAGAATSTLQLPAGVLEHLLTTSSQRQLACLATVCKEWNETVTKTRTQLSVHLKSDAGSSSISFWLQRCASQLKQLQLAHMGTYGRSCHPNTRLQLFQALHEACSGPAAATAAADTAHHCNSASESETLSSVAVDVAVHNSSRSVGALGNTPAAAQAVHSRTDPPGLLSSQQQPQQLNYHQHTGNGPAARSHPSPLQVTDLGANMRLTPADCAAIGSLPVPHLSSLQLLGSRTRRLGIDGIRSLLQLQQLSSLTVSRFGIGDDATVLLARGLPGLQVLCLSGNNIGPVGAGAVGDNLSGLQQLDMSINRCGHACTSGEALYTCQCSSGSSFWSDRYCCCKALSRLFRQYCV